MVYYFAPWWGKSERLNPSLFNFHSSIRINPMHGVKDDLVHHSAGFINGLLLLPDIWGAQNLLHYWYRFVIVLNKIEKNFENNNKLKYTIRKIRSRDLRKYFPILRILFRNKPTHLFVKFEKILIFFPKTWNYILIRQVFQKLYFNPAPTK